MPADLLLLLSVALPFAGAALPALMGGASATRIAWATAAVPLAVLASLAPLLPRLFVGEVPEAGYAWVPALGLGLSFRLDGLAALFAVLICLIGLLVILYARYYLSPRDPIGRLFAVLLAFMGAMLGIVLSDNLLLLVVFWELTGLTSFLLIGYWSHRSDSREGARIALTVTGLGGLALLGGTLLLGDIAGTFEISEIVQRGEAVRASALYVPALLLILLGAFTKSAQVPFHFWLPSAMAAPTPVSAYLHSATMVKAGLFLLARLHPALSGTDAWFFLVGGAGLVTLVFGAYSAMFRHDLKGLLAYSTVSHLGLIMLLLGIGTEMAVVAAVFHVINHATFKASLFMAAGIIDHETGTRDMRKLAGLFKYMPHTAVLAMVAAASMAGVPLLNGFLSKEMFFDEALRLRGLGFADWVVPVVATAAGAFGVAYSLRFIHDVFFHGEPKGLPRQPHEPPRWMKIPVEILVALCLLVGILPQYTVKPVLDLAAGAVLNAPAPQYSLALWHGFTLPLLMSTIALVAGVALYFWLQFLYKLHRHEHGPWTGHRVFNALQEAAQRGANVVLRVFANGSLQRYCAMLVAVALVAGFAAFDGVNTPSFVLTPVDGPALAAWLLLVAASGAVAVLHRSRLDALILTGAVGLVVSAAFAYFSAPDLALTQLVVEVASVILLVLVLRFLPQTTPRESAPGRRARDLGLALAAGAGSGAIAWWLLTSPHDTISQYFVDNSLPLGGGTNVVNVILVDFRGFDTLGEITVLALAALGVVGLLGSGTARSEAAPPAEPRSLMLSNASQILLPAALLVALYIFLRGHNLPGGGFIAGLVAGAAGILLYVANGIAWSEARIRIRYRALIAAGLASASGTGLAAWLFGAPFLTSAHGHAHLPVIGELPLASAMVFDLGIFLTVVGVVMLALSTLGHLQPEQSWKRF
jgi:multicomponent K+:H+ antiporter subunit A